MRRYDTLKGAILAGLVLMLLALSGGQVGSVARTVLSIPFKLLFGVN